MLIYLPLDTYLRQWFVNDMGGHDPVILGKYSIEAKTLEIALQRQPHGTTPLPRQQGEVAIVIPEYRAKPPEIYHYLTAKGIKAMQDCIRKRFDVQLFRDLYHPQTFGGCQESLLDAWMDAHGIEVDDTNSRTVMKRFRLLRRAELDRQRKRARKS